MLWEMKGTDESKAAAGQPAAAFLARFFPCGGEGTMFSHSGRRNGEILCPHRLKICLGGESICVSFIPVSV